MYTILVGIMLVGRLGVVKVIVVVAAAAADFRAPPRLTCFSACFVLLLRLGVGPQQLPGARRGRRGRGPAHIYIYIYIYMYAYIYIYIYVYLYLYI